MTFANLYEASVPPQMDVPTYKQPTDLLYIC